MNVSFEVFPLGELGLNLHLYDLTNYDKYFYQNQPDSWYNLKIHKDGCVNKLEFEDISLQKNCSK